MHANFLSCPLPSATNTVSHAEQKQAWKCAKNLAFGPMWNFLKSLPSLGMNPLHVNADILIALQYSTKCVMLLIVKD